MFNVEQYINWMFRHRTRLLGVFAGLTAVIAVSAFHLRVDASFNKSLPRDHDYIRTYEKYQNEFGGANQVLVALMVRDGDIFQEAYFTQLKRVTEEMALLPSVDQSRVQSLFTSPIRVTNGNEESLPGGNAAGSGAHPSGENFAQLRNHLIESGQLGQLVANNFSGAIVSAQLLEIDPSTGAKVDYIEVANRLEAIRERVERETSGAITVHIVGFAKIMRDVRADGRGILLIFAVAVFVTSLLVWNYAGRWKLAAAPILCSLIAVVWQLGLVNLLGFGINVFSVLVPFLVFAIGVSHGVQKICAFRNGLFKGLNGGEAARDAFKQLIMPGMVALVTDSAGFITLLVIKIPVIQELAVMASIGVSVIVITNFFLLPILLSYIYLPPSYSDWVANRRLRADAFWRRLANGMKPQQSQVIIVLSFALGGWAFLRSGEVRIGDTQAGAPELRPESRYNSDTRVITENFTAGGDVLSVIVESAPNGSVDYEVMALMDKFEGFIRELTEVQSVISLSTVAKRINSAFNEGSLKWRVLPRNEHALAQVVAASRSTVPLVNSDGSARPILIYLRDHRAETLRAVTAAVKEFAAANPSSKAELRLASGRAGVMAATNEVVAAAEKPMLLWVFGAVFVLCLVTFRSVRAALCIVTPLAIVSYLAYALMVHLGIGLKPSTLPVLALGVGIGVDYGIYIFARLNTALHAGEYFEDAMFSALKDAGAAVVFTGLTLAISVGSWMFSNLKFQADMGLLLTFMFLLNMIGAIIVMPAIARWLWRHHSDRPVVQASMWQR